MTNGANPSQLFWPAHLIEQATGIIMNHFDLDAAQAVQVLRKMSQKTRTQMCVVAEQIINHNMPVKSAEADYILFMAAHDFPEIDEPGEPAEKLRGHPD